MDSNSEQYHKLPFESSLFGVFNCGLLVKEVAATSGGARGVMVIVVGNGHGDTSSNPGRD